MMLKVIKSEHGKEITTVYEGRFIGLITNGEFAEAMNSYTLRRAAYTTESKDIEVLRNRQYNEVVGFHLAFTVYRKNEQPVLKQTLYISRPIHYINCETDNEIFMTTKGGDFLNIRR